MADQPIGSDDVEAYAIPYLDANGRIDTRVSDASTTRAGKVMLATDGEESATKAVAADDSRLDDERAPAHASSHVGGTDPIPSATISNDGLMTASQVTTLENLDALGSADLGTVLAFEASELGVAYESTDYYTHSKHAIAYGKKPVSYSCFKTDAIRSLGQRRFQQPIRRIQNTFRWFLDMTGTMILQRHRLRSLLLN